MLRSLLQREFGHDHRVALLLDQWRERRRDRLGRSPQLPFSHFPLIVSALAFHHGRHHRSDQTMAPASP